MAFVKPTEGAPTKELPGGGALVGVDGNAFAVMGFVAQALSRAGASKSYVDSYRQQAMGGDYDNLLAVSFQALED